MSTKKGKSGGRSSVGGAEVEDVIQEGTAVRVKYDDVWYHGDVNEVVEVVEEGGIKKTRCIVAFEDEETTDAEFPSLDAQVLMSPNVLADTIRSAGEAQGRLCTDLTEVLNKKSLPAQFSHAISSALFPLADQIRQGKKNLKTERDAVKELLAALERHVKPDDKPLLKPHQWESWMAKLHEYGPGFRFSLLKDKIDKNEKSTDVSNDGKDSSVKHKYKSKNKHSQGVEEEEAADGKANKETDKDKKKRNKEPEKVKDDEGKQKEKQATPQRADTKDTKEPKASKADKGKARSSLQGQDKDDTNARDAALLDRFKAKNRECEVFADEEWWNAKVVKWRFNEEEARDEVYIHFQGTGKEEDVWMPLSAEVIQDRAGEGDEDKVANDADDIDEHKYKKSKKGSKQSEANEGGGASEKKSKGASKEDKDSKSSKTKSQKAQTPERGGERDESDGSENAFPADAGPRKGKASSSKKAKGEARFSKGIDGGDGQEGMDGEEASGGGAGGNKKGGSGSARSAGDSGDGGAGRKDKGRIGKGEDVEGGVARPLRDASKTKNASKGSGQQDDAMEVEAAQADRDKPINKSSKKRKRGMLEVEDKDGDKEESQDAAGAGADNDRAGERGWPSAVCEYMTELKRLHKIYKQFKDSSSKLDLARLGKEIEACHMRLHRRTAGLVVAGVYRSKGVVCITCGAATPGHRPLDVWNKDMSQCSRCSDHYQARKYCAVCDKVIRDLERQNNILKCQHCDLWVHAKCDGLDELALVTMRLASAHAYLCPKHRRTGPGLAYTAGDLTMIPIKDKPPQLPANPQKQPQAAHSAPSQEANAGLDMTLSSIFGLRVGADGRLLYGVEYEHTGSTCAKALQWQAACSSTSCSASGPEQAPKDAVAAPGPAQDVTDPALLARFLTTLCPHGSLLHPCQPDARERARRWGEMVVCSGGLEAPLKMGNMVMQEPAALMVQAVTGIRRMPAHLFALAHQHGANHSGMPPPQAATDTYIEVQRGGLRAWTRLPERNSKLQELVGAFLLSSVGVLSIHLGPALRESLLRQAKLWDAFCQGLGDPSVTAGSLLATPAAAASGLKLQSPWPSVGEGEEGGAVDLSEMSLVGAMLVRNGETGIVVQHSDGICLIRFDSGETVSIAADDILDWLV